ncbi:hypothetical protein GUJ93_ZPchr0001g32726 [Zizania palustris]|uniref:UspA domain-containing protein n=1 Tax=Zizania palustris TaxID=103762 RepID=A0A8J5RQ15_ZIZPA|nr:hypothetical protein GUJ93_ZPchr0001g32726 [Zizania palustris]
MASPAPAQLQRGEPKPQKVMVAVDESECSHYALEWALRSLAPVIAPPLLVLTVQPLLPIGYVSAASFGAPPPELIKSMQERQQQLSKALIDKAKEICAQHGVSVETMIEVGDPKEMICEAAEKSKVDLLIVGSHSRGPVQRYNLVSQNFLIYVVI